MKTSGREREYEGWDESVLVWNATVARIPAPPAVGIVGDAEVDNKASIAFTSRVVRTFAQEVQHGQTPSSWAARVSRRGRAVGRR